MVDMENVLYYGDNLDILKRYVKDESVDLIYLDQPFNSNQNYNVLFKEKDGTSVADTPLEAIPAAGYADRKTKSRILCRSVSLLFAVK